MKFFKGSKLTLILGIIYIILMIGLLFGMSSAKYRETKIVYSSFGAASFNAVILGDSSDGIVKAFEETIDTLGKYYKPGMTYVDDTTKNTARIIPFTIANGVAEENVSEVGIDYTIKLRTTGNLPLDYTLMCGDATYVTSTPSAVTVEGNDVNWYEYTFKEQSASEEKLFSLSAGSDDSGLPYMNHYKLVVEWPIEKNDLDSAGYMKEVEIFQVLVTVSSKNSLDEAHVITPADISPEEMYGTGLVILGSKDGVESGNIYDYSYQMDYRSFRNVTVPLDTTSGSAIVTADRSFTGYPFVVENGAYKGINNTARNTYFSFKLKTPVNELTEDFLYSMYCQDIYDYDRDGNTTEYLRLSSIDIEYRKYDVYDGSYVVLEDDPFLQQDDGELAEILSATDSSSSRFRCYKVFTFQWPLSALDALNDNYGDHEAIFRLDNREINITTGEVKNTKYSENCFIVELDTVDHSPVSITSEEAVSNRMELLIEANSTDSTSVYDATTTKGISPQVEDEPEEPDENNQSGDN